MTILEPCDMSCEDMSCYAFILEFMMTCHVRTSPDCHLSWSLTTCHVRTCPADMSCEDMSCYVFILEPHDDMSCEDMSC